MVGEAVTVERFEECHRVVCDLLTAHDKRAQNIELSLERVAVAQASQAEAHAAQAKAQVSLIESQQRTQTNVEDATQTLKVATGILKTAADAINLQANTVNWMQGEISANRKARNKEIARYIGVMVVVIVTLVGAKGLGLI